MSEQRIAADFIAEHNSGFEKSLKSDYQALGEQLLRRGIEIDTITDKVAAYYVAVPSGAQAQAAPASGVFRAAASRAAFSTSWTIAPSSTSFAVPHRMFPCIFHGTRPIRRSSKPMPKRLVSASTP